MRHPRHLPPNVPSLGVLIPAESLQRSCMELGVCQGDGRCEGCDSVEPPARHPAEPLWDRWGHAITVAALAGVSAGVLLGALRWALDWVGQ